MRRTLAILAIMALGALTPLSVQAGDTALAPLETTLEVTGAYAYATTSVQKNGAVFATFANNSDTPKRIIAAQIPEGEITERIELHTHLMDDGIMMMREVEGYDIPANEAVTLTPMGHHIMLFGLKTPLKIGESFPMEVTTGSGETLDFDVEIVAPGTKLEEGMSE